MSHLFLFRDIDQLEVDMEAIINQGLDYSLVMGFTSELMLLELLNRILITLFEVCIQAVILAKTLKDRK